MKKLLTLLFVLIAFIASAQDIVPQDTAYHNLPTYSFRYYTKDSSVWIYKGAKYQTTKLVSNKRLKFLIDSLDKAGANKYIPLLAAQTTSHYTGFPNRTSTSIGFNNGTYTFTLTATNDTIWIKGKAYNINTKIKQLSVAQESVSGLYWFWLKTQGDTIALDCDITFPGFDKCLVGSVYWNTTTNKGITSDERHWMGRDHWMHEYLHETVGPRVKLDGGLEATFTAATFSVAQGEYYDEDIEHNIATSTIAKVLYHNGDSDWTWDILITPYKEVAGELAFNNGNTLTGATANRFVNYWMFATGDVVHPIQIVIGTAQYTTIDAARAAGIPQLGGLATAENKIIWKAIYKNTSGTPTFQESIDYRTASSLPSNAPLATDHGTLTGLTDLDHPATAIINTPVNNITRTTVQAALNQMDSIKHNQNDTLRNKGRASRWDVFGQRETNKLPKFNTDSTFVKSVIFDNGKVHINGTAPDSMLTVTGGAHFTTGIKIDQVSGKPPFIIASTDSVTNLNAAMLDGEHKSYFIAKSEKGANNGVATLDAGGKVPLTQMNDGLLGAVRYQALYNATTNTPALPLASVSKGYYYIIDVGGTVGGIVYNPGDWIISSGLAWGKVDNNNAISSVFGRVGNITATSGDYTADQITETASRVFVSPTEKSNFNTAYGWGNHASAGYGLASALTTHAGLTITAHGLGASAFHADSYFQTALTNPVTGIGNTNYIAKWTGSSTIGNTHISEGSIGVRVLSQVNSSPMALGTYSGSFGITNTSGVYGLYMGTDPSGFSWMQGGRIDGNTTAYNLVLQNAGGYVGVGVNALAKLHVKENDNMIIQKLSGQGQDYAVFYNGGSSPDYGATDEGAVLNLGTRGGSPYKSIHAHGGAVFAGIAGTVSVGYAYQSDYKLKVNGNSYFNGTGTFIGNLTAPSINLSTGAILNYFWKCTNATTGAGQWAAISSSQNYNGAWSAATNTPTLSNGVGTSGSYYHCTVSGTVNFGAGNITFVGGQDDVWYNGSIWEKNPGAQYALTTMSSVALGGAKLGSGMNVGGEGTDILNILNEDKGDITVSGSGNQYGRAWSIDAQNSAFWAGKITDETGSGSVVFSTSPTLVTPALGTPSALVGTNITGTASALNIGGNAATASATTAAVTFNSSGTGDASGTTFNGSTARTISYNSIGAQVAGSYATGTGSATGTNTGDNATNSQYSGLVTMTYPGSGVPVSTGTAWGTSLATSSSSSANALVKMNSSGYVQLVGTFCSSSDSTLKRKIRPLSETDYTKAAQIDFRKFAFKADSTGKNHFGVMAQQVEKLFPELVNTGANGKKDVDYIELHSLLLAQQKELIAKQSELIEKLTKRIDELEKNPFGKMEKQTIYSTSEYINTYLPDSQTRTELKNSKIKDEN